MKVVIIGIDGATLDVINPLVKQNRLPLFKKFMDEGSHGVLKSVKPMISPALWTEMVTGRSRKDNKIEEFVKTGGSKLVNSNDRETLAIWNILSSFKRNVGIVGWWTTWPAEFVKGFNISDRVSRSRHGEWTGSNIVSHYAAHLTYPPKLYDEIKPLIVDPTKSDPNMKEISSLVKLNEQEKIEFLNVKKPIFAHGLSVFKFAYSAQRTYEKIALYMLENNEQPDFTALFLIAIDPISHTFWHFFESKKFNGVPSDDARRLGKLIPNFYQHNDRFLTKLLNKIDPNTVVFIVSDHGFQASGQLPQEVSIEQYEKYRKDALKNEQVAIGQSGKHHIDGIFFAYGGPIKKGAQITSNIADITPTILALMGLPVAKNMQGRVLEEIIESEFFKKHPVQFIDSYEKYIERNKVDLQKPPEDKEMKDRLRSLGYIN